MLVKENYLIAAMADGQRLSCIMNTLFSPKIRKYDSLKYN